uniref:DUF4129 domain-containing protein n=1 Tax=Thermogladius calderae TaxID=1200300 RepID=A0A7J3Y0P9_9CREN
MDRLPHLLIMMIILLQPLLPPSQAEQTSYIIGDCTYLLAILEKTLRYALTLDPTGLDLARVLANTTVRSDLSDLHAKSYALVIDYYNAMKKPNLTDVSELYNLYNNLGRIQDYASRLHACAADPSSASTLSIGISSLLAGLKSRVRGVLDSIGGGNSPISLIVDTNKVYEPGEGIPIVVSSNRADCTVRYITLAAGSIPINTTSLNCTSTACHVVLKAPLASDLTSYLGSIAVSPEDVSIFTVIAGAVCSGVEIELYRLIRIGYYTPRLILEAPATVVRGSTLNISIASRSGVLQGTVFVKNAVNETSLGNITIGETPLTLSLDTGGQYFEVGINTIRVCVEAGSATLSYCIEKPVVVEPRYPHVVVEASPVYITLDGWIQVPLLSYESRELESLVAVSASSGVKAPVENNTVVSLYASLPPVSTAKLVVEIYDPAGYYDTYYYSQSILVVNISSLIILTLIGSVVLVLIRDREKAFMVALTTLSSPRVREKMGSTVNKVEELLEPYTRGLGSRIAQLYYGVLKKIVGRLPQPSETLREHYRWVVAATTKSNRVKELIWRFLQLVERDLYSNRKPSYEEGLELSRGILIAAEEE